MSFLSRIILNEGVKPGPVPEQPVDVALTLAMADLKANYIDSETGVVRYVAIRGSREFERYKDLSGGLRTFDLRLLDRREKRLAFWINIYNTAVIHGVIELGLQKSVKEFFRFFHRVAYEIGGHQFSLNDMEHGILRGNRRPPYGFLKPFNAADPRLSFAVLPMDPRIHFALVCGARSCPPVSFYEADQVEGQLQLAALSFVNSPRVKIVPQEKTVFLSMIFKWYKTDFGGANEALIDTLLQSLDEGEAKTYLKENRDRVRIKYQPYDWNLNR